MLCAWINTYTYNFEHFFALLLLFSFAWHLFMDKSRNERINLRKEIKKHLKPPKGLLQLAGQAHGTSQGAAKDMER